MQHKNKKLIRILAGIWRGQTLLRTFMNLDFENYFISGMIIDVGGGRSPDYFKHIRHPKDLSIEVIDGSTHDIDFEKDQLPFKFEAADGIILCNVLEHIYRYNFLLRQIHRVLKPDALLLGFVPFLINYHPDPHDYFRYTKEALELIITEAGFKDVTITPVGRGPFSVNFNNIMFSIPKIFRVVVYPIYHFLDTVFLYFRPKTPERFPLGYIFYATKSSKNL